MANVRDFKLCNVTIIVNSHESLGNDAISYEPWDPGTFNFSVHDCTFRCPTFVNEWYWAVAFYPYRYGATAPTVNLELKKTEFYNFGIGVCFDNSDPVDDGTILVDTDCHFFSGVIHKVYECGSQTEYCP